MEKKEVFVITADVIKSKSFLGIETVIKENLDKVNTMFTDTLYTKFTSLKGDEFQAIVEKEAQNKLLKIIREIRHQMGKHKVRIGVGYGTINNISSKNNEFGSWELNGEAFYKARSVVDELRMKKKSSVQMSTMFNIFENQTKNETINLLYFNVDRTLSSWKEENWLMAKYLEEDKTHAEIAELMNKDSENKKNRGSYTKKINRSDWYLVQEIEELITKIFKEGLN